MGTPGLSALLRFMKDKSIMEGVFGCCNKKNGSEIKIKNLTDPTLYTRKLNSSIHDLINNNDRANLSDVPLKYFETTKDINMSIQNDSYIVKANSPDIILQNSSTSSLKYE